ncbi:hypothetical protein AB0D67_17325 [Streptosporangium sp. NPDC048047]|uniref:hypothetical protein n=1 Tax=Streptosporangium sp. NPDC048047 TaxID=3155748 RepID=UPI0034284A00
MTDIRHHPDLLSVIERPLILPCRHRLTNKMSPRPDLNEAEGHELAHGVLARYPPLSVRPTK